MYKRWCVSEWDAHFLLNWGVRCEKNPMLHKFWLYSFFFCDNGGAFYFWKLFFWNFYFSFFYFSEKNFSARDYFRGISFFIFQILKIYFSIFILIMNFILLKNYFMWIISVHLFCFNIIDHYYPYKILL